MLALKEIPSITDGVPESIETKICTSCGLAKDINAFGWRYCYIERLTACKYCRNRQAKLDATKKRFKSFNKLSVMKWTK